MDTSREEKLILDCLTIDKDNSHALDALIKPGEAINWGNAVSLSGRHDVASLLYASLSKSSFRENIPQDLFKLLKDGYFANFYRNTILWTEFISISYSAREAGIALIPFKGIILSHLLYGDIGLRMFADMDILVKQGDLPVIKGILINRGYRETIEKDGYLFGKSVNPGLYSYVELHLSFVPPRPNIIEIPHLWQNLRT